MIEISRVSKRFEALVALDEVSLAIPKGEVLGLLGPNGAGKTTLMRVICGLLQPDAGQVRSTNGRWPTIGYKPERLLYPNQMRVYEYLQMTAALSNLPAVAQEAAVRQSLQRVNLLHAAQKRIRDCSKGMRQRLGLAQAIIGNPPLLILDEPSNGLDPEGQMEIVSVVKSLHAEGKTIVFSSHQLGEVTQVCTQLVIMNQGRIHYRNSMAVALNQRPHITIIVDGDLTPFRQLLQEFHPQIEVQSDRVLLHNEAMTKRAVILSILLSLGCDVVYVAQEQTSLAEIYAEVVQ